MRSFEQYINELRHNYIFGGTDNRNTNVKLTLKDLQVGDKLYYWTKWAEDKKLYQCGTISKIEDSPEFYKGKLVYYVRKNGRDSIWLCDTYKDLNASFMTDSHNFVCATTFDELKTRVKDIFNFDIYEDDAIIFESSQKYIFGGTDDRNTEVAPDAKTFAELKKGDKIYASIDKKILDCKIIRIQRAKWTEISYKDKEGITRSWTLEYERLNEQIISHTFDNGEIRALCTSKELLQHLLDLGDLQKYDDNF